MYMKPNQILTLVQTFTYPVVTECKAIIVGSFMVTTQSA